MVAQQRKRLAEKTNMQRITSAKDRLGRSCQLKGVSSCLKTRASVVVLTGKLQTHFLEQYHSAFTEPAVRKTTLIFAWVTTVI